MSAHVHIPGDPRTIHLVLEQVEKILRSERFTGSELLRNLLSYLAKRATEHPGESVKEYDLAVDVFGRDPGFDSRLDSAVRVHTSRLRAKLAEYYMSEGAGDAVVIEIPKGAYLIQWHVRALVPEVSPKAPEIVKPVAAGVPARPWSWFAVGFGCAAVIGVAAWMTVAPRTASVPPPVAAFWRPFLGTQPQPILVFSNHRFVGTSSTGLRAYRDGVDVPGEMNDTYSGTGTVMAVHQLGSLLARFGREVRVKRAELLTWDEAQNTNLILVGSPEANSRLQQVPLLRQFGFKSSRAEPRLGFGGIINLHPGPGEPEIYYGSGIPYTSDYAVLAMLPGLQPEHRILVLAGTNTYGVQAAAEFASRADLTGELLGKLKSGSGGRVPDFEALIEVGVSGGVPVQSRLVTVRAH
jgi:hypothetical protein